MLLLVLGQDAVRLEHRDEVLRSNSYSQFVGQFVNVGDPKTSDDYAEYVWTEGNKWEFIGRVASEVDLSDYAKTTYVDGLVEEINNRISALETSSHTHTNKEILDQITAPFTTEDKTKLDSLENYDDTALAGRVTAIEADYIKSTDDLTLNCML